MPDYYGHWVLRGELGRAAILKKLRLGALFTWGLPQAVALQGVEKSAKSGSLSGSTTPGANVPLLPPQYTTCCLGLQSKAWAFGLHRSSEFY